MPADVSLHSGNYVRSAYYGLLDSTYFIGQGTTAPVAGNQDGSAMRQLEAVKSWPLAPAAADRPTQTGDGGAYKRFINRPTELPAGEATFGAADKTFQALCESMVKRNTGGGQFVLRGPYSPTYRNFIFMVQGPSLSSESTSLDEEMWEGTIYMNCQVQPMGRNSYDTGSLPDYLYSLVANYGTRHIWGEALDSTADGDTKSVMVDFTWPYQLMFQRYTLDGTILTLNLEKTLAEDSADNLIVYRTTAGVSTALTWVAGAPGAAEFGADLATSVITLGAVGTAADVVVVGYGFLGS
jgi:hypothetical protein